MPAGHLMGQSSLQCLHSSEVLSMSSHKYNSMCKLSVAINTYFNFLLCVFTHPEHSYRMWCVRWVWLRSPIKEGHDPESSGSDKGKKMILHKTILLNKLYREYTSSNILCSPTRYTKCFNAWIYSALMLARHVSDLIGPSSEAFFTSCIRRFGMW